jgi:hypothetical protein
MTVFAVDAVDAVIAFGTTAPQDCASCPFTAIGPPRSWVEGVEPSPSCESLSPSRHAMASGEAVGRRSELRSGGRESPARSLEVWMAVDAVDAVGPPAPPDRASCPFTAIGPPRSWVEGVEPSPSCDSSPPSRHAMASGEALGRRSEVRAGGREPPAGSLEVWMAVDAVDAVDVLDALFPPAPPDCASCPSTAIGPPRSWVEGVEPSPSCEFMRIAFPFSPRDGVT